MQEKKERIHLVGIGGIGMSSLARLLKEEGYQVSGSDAKTSELLITLQKEGVEIFVGHAAEHVKGADIVVYSSAISSCNPEIVYAKEQGVPIMMRAQMLALLHKNKKTIAVCGTHGKSTTTGMIASVLTHNGLDPTISLGAAHPHFNGNAKKGSGEYFVVETDESDGSFLFFDPYYCVVTNIEPEHMDYYHTMDSVIAHYRTFIDKVPHQGKIIACKDCPTVQTILPAREEVMHTYGLCADAQVTAKNIILSERESTFTVLVRGVPQGEIRLKVPGTFNVTNALGVIGLCLSLGIEFRIIQEALATFTGVKRRFEVVGRVRDVMVIDDYAHHPTEIKAVLNAATFWPDRKKRICVFQPHRYSRVHELMDAFVESFYDADEVFILDIYSAGETNTQGVSAQLLVEKLREKGVCASYVQKDMLEPVLLAKVSAYDMVLFLGAGDITLMARAFVKALTADKDIYINSLK